MDNINNCDSYRKNDFYICYALIEIYLESLSFLFSLSFRSLLLTGLDAVLDKPHLTTLFQLRNLGSADGLGIKYL
jgi:hypothetical protein